MGKVLIFGLLWWLTGSPILAAIVLLIILYMLERRYVGLTPSVVKPLRRFGAIKRLRQQIAMNPNDLPAKHELARLLIERKRYAEAKSWLMPLQDALENSAEFWDDLGACLHHLGETEAAEAATGNALSINPRVKYGTPYLRLAAIYAKKEPQKAIGYLQSFRGIHSSSIEAYYRLAGLYALLGQHDEAKRMLAECGTIYRSLPRYKKRQERKWALLAWLRGMRS
ncbi:tetratricopeptide repeat protein [Paenibacillus lycopersici]|uniref:Tetratricopeptide repeat protein n=1 Tax=Paenibacillus lycopersici TaxID=2704462 RepID=A0A6C0FZG3_9BACL|nr:tetratricopeptide repeat protein [Paenibacillus lycopersici]QHT62528.1 tetratricopeptide repeat protein [Paenibacillus lycopersici]